MNVKPAWRRRGGNRALRTGSANRTGSASARTRVQGLPRISEVVAWTCCVLCGLLLSGCHWDMWDNARIKPLEKSAFFADKSSARNLVPGTVSYQSRAPGSHFSTGKVDDDFAKTLPADITLNRKLLERGQDRFTIYCTPCHGALGNGQGMVVQRGFPPPPSYHIDRLREVPIGYFFDVMTNGFGRMYSYATRVPPDDRWAIAAYVRTLQVSQAPEILPPEVLEELEKLRLAAIEEAKEPVHDEH